MPRRSERQELLLSIRTASQTAHQLWEADLEQQFEEEADISDSSESDGLPGFILSPISPSSPILIIPELLFNSESELHDSDSSSDSDGSNVSPTSRYDHFVGAIAALEKEVLQARVLRKPLAPPMRAPQIHVLAQCQDHPEAFHKKLWVDHDIFDDILD